MKNFISIYSIFIVAITLFAFLLINQNNHYAITVQVVEIDCSTDTVTFEDIKTSNLWQTDNIKDV